MPSSLTPVKVRGKRSGLQAEKNVSTQQVGGTDKTRVRGKGCKRLPTDTVAKPSSKRRKTTLSRLEQLPCEIIQLIFLYSENLDLPLTSSSLAAQLSSRHLQKELRDKVLHVLLDPADPLDPPTKENGDDLRNVQRLLNSRFMTWGCFKEWLEQEHRKSMQSPAEIFWPLDRLETAQACLERRDYAAMWDWFACAQPHFPPLKLLRGPWTEDKVAFLTFFARRNPKHPDSSFEEITYRGLSQAVEERSIGAINAFMALDAPLDQDLLRSAIIDHECDIEALEMLLCSEIERKEDEVHSGEHNRWSRHVIDYLDPVLWAWVDKAVKARPEAGKLVTRWLRQGVDLMLLEKGKGTRDRFELHPDYIDLVPSS